LFSEKIFRPAAADRPSLVKEMAVSSALIQCPAIAGLYASSSSKLSFKRMRQAILSFYLYTLSTGYSSFHILKHAWQGKGFVAPLANKLVRGHGQHLLKGIRAKPIAVFFINLGPLCQICGFCPKCF
jgi:hypothetical protein